MSSTELPTKWPEGATHWAPESQQFYPAFAKKEDGRWMILTLFAFRQGNHCWGPRDPNNDPSRYIELPLPAPWINYAEQRPTVAGAYRWRMESVALPGMFVTFVTRMRKRGAGFTDVLSPTFDYWDGYSVHVPAGLQWQPLRAEDPQGADEYRVVGVEVEGLSPLPCPYCNKVPVFEGWQRFSGGGADSGKPYHYNDWKLKCCGWGTTPSCVNPIELVKRRDSVLSRLRPAPVVTP